MATNTPKLNLIKPTEISDFVDVDQLNTNMDIIDGKLGPITEDAWTAFVPVFTTAGGGAPTVGTGGNANLSGRFKQIGKTVIAQYFLRFGNVGPNSGVGNWELSLPVAAKLAPASMNTSVLATGYLEDAGVVGYYLIGAILTAAGAKVTPLVPSATLGQTRSVQSAIPFAWGADDYCTFTITYEAA